MHNGARHGRHAELVSVVGHAGDHAGPNHPRVQHTGRQIINRKIGWPEAQNVGQCDRSGTHAEHVAHHPTDARVGAAERFNSRRVVVGLGLDGEIEMIIERHDAGVVDERGVYPRRVDLIGGSPQLLQQRHRCGAVSEGDPSAERFVVAVLAPGLGDHLQLDVRRLAIKLAIVVGDGRHLDPIERHASLRRKREKFVGRQRRDGYDFGGAGGVAAHKSWRDLTDSRLLDDRIGEQPRDKVLKIFVAKNAGKLEPATGGDLADVAQPDELGATQDGFGPSIRHARQQGGFNHDHPGPRFGVGRDRAQEWIAEQTLADQLNRFVAQLAVEEHQIAAGDRSESRNTEGVSVGQKLVGTRVVTHRSYDETG